MTPLRDISDLGDRAVALTVGNFDGVHLGHRALLAALRDGAGAAATLVVTFAPHPLEVLEGRRGFLINSRAERAALLADQGIDHLLEIPFDAGLGRLAPEDFLRRFLAAPGLSRVVVGHDFAFGAGAGGGADLLSSFFRGSPVSVERVGPFAVDGRTPSSTAVRRLLAAGDVEGAAALLGRPHFLGGRVGRGRGRGRRIGFPTANARPDPSVALPGRGVYATRTAFAGDPGTFFKSVTNVGAAPTFGGGGETRVEAHVLDLGRDVRGEEARVEFLSRLRDERRFPGAAELVAQIRRDVERRRAM